MSALPERREPIDIEEFERRLRGPAEPRGSEDPLAELARLVSTPQPAPEVDPFAALMRQPPRPAAAPGVGLVPPIPPAPPDHARFDDPAGMPGFGAGSYDAPASPPPLDFPDLRPLLRGGDFPLEPPVPAAAPHAPPPPDAAAAIGEFHGSAEYETWAEAERSVAPQAPELDAPRVRSRKPLYVAAAVIAAGFVAIGSTLAFRGGGHTSGGIAMIKAASTPTKVKPKAVEDGENTPHESTMLDKTPAPTVKKVVSNDEQPMDVAAAVKTLRIIPLSDDISPTTGGEASAVAVPPPPLRGPANGNSAFPEPKRVKTVAVRADGSIISGGDAAAPPKPAPAAAPPARDATPKAETRAATSTPAPARRVEAKPAPRPPKVEARAPARPAPKPALVAAAPAPEAAPAAEEETTSRASSGAYSVQLAAPDNEAAARTMAARLGEKYGSALGGRRPSVHKAADKAVYRIRVTGLSREAANAMCGRIKSAGGACFVAR